MASDTENGKLFLKTNYQSTIYMRIMSMYTIKRQHMLTRRVVKVDVDVTVWSWNQKVSGSINCWLSDCAE
jgi:hypothetical protein